MNIEDFRVEKLGECRIDNPIQRADFIADESRVAYSSNTVELANCVQNQEEIPSFEAAGIRSKIFHDPTWSKAAIITAGGLCPGLNHVVKFLTRTLKTQYKVPVVYGIRYGYRGLVPRYHYEPMI